MEGTVAKKGLTPADLEELEGSMLQLPQVSIPVIHHFGPGVYMREIIMPPGIWAMGHSHTEDCLNIVLTGRASLAVDGEIQELKAPAIFLSKARDRKLGYIHEELRHITIHPNPDNQTNPDDIEDRIIEKTDTHQAWTKLYGDAQKALQSSNIMGLEI